MKDKKIERFIDEARCAAETMAETIRVCVKPSDFSTVAEYVAECRTMALDSLSEGDELEAVWYNSAGISEKDYDLVTAEVDAVYTAVKLGDYDCHYAFAWKESYEDHLAALDPEWYIVDESGVSEPMTATEVADFVGFDGVLWDEGDLLDYCTRRAGTPECDSVCWGLESAQELYKKLKK